MKPSVVHRGTHAFLSTSLASGPAGQAAGTQRGAQWSRTRSRKDGINTLEKQVELESHWVYEHWLLSA